MHHHVTARVSRRMRNALLGAVILASLTGISSAQPYPDGTVWIAESNGVLILSSVGDVLTELPEAAHMDALAIDTESGNVWAYGQKEIRAYTRDGSRFLSQSMPASTHGGTPTGMALDSRAHRLWIALGRNLYRYDAAAQLQATLTFARDITALSLDRRRGQVWVASQGELSALDANGTRLFRLDLGPQARPRALAYDAVHDQTWMAIDGQLRRYDSAGVLAFQSPLSSSDIPSRLSASGDGWLWTATEQSLARIDVAGQQDFVLEPFKDASPGARHIVDISADPLDGTVWVASTREIRHFGRDGRLLQVVTPQLGDGVIRRLSKLDVNRDLIPPEVYIVAPKAGQYLRTRRPAVSIEYFDLGMGVDPNSIRFQSNGSAVAVHCETLEFSARCVPPQELPEGQTLLSAKVSDRAGNASEPASVSFVLDVTPPAFLGLAPATDHFTNQADLTLTGRLSEPAAITINGADVPVDAGFAFRYQAALQEGANNFALSATDRAGNRGTQSHRINLDTLPPAAADASAIAVGSPSGGAVAVTGRSGSVEAGSLVTIINTVTGQRISVMAGADGSFAASIQAEAGQRLTIAVNDRAGNQSEPLAVQVAGAFKLTVSQPIDAAVVTEPTILVSGTVEGTARVGVTVNGAIASIGPGPGGARFAAVVSLELGDNMLTVTATRPDGGTAARTVTVTRAASPSPFEVSMNGSEVLAPFAAQLSISGNSAPRISNLEIDFDGNGSWDYQKSYPPSVPVSYTYLNPGSYTARVRISTDYYQTYEHRLPIVVLDRAQLDQSLRAIWSDLWANLNAGNSAAALNNLSFDSRELYGQIFEQLKSRMPGIASDMSDVQPVGLSPDLADYVVLNHRDGKARVFFVNFIRGADGLWRIDSL